jgi:hypothetical protein
MKQDEETTSSMEEERIVIIYKDLQKLKSKKKQHNNNNKTPQNKTISSQTKLYIYFLKEDIQRTDGFMKNAFITHIREM